MSTFTATAGSSSTIGFAKYGSSSWSTGTSNGACQGAYQDTTASTSRVGVMVFSGAGAALSGKVISQDFETCHSLLAEEEKDPEILRTLAP